MEAVVNSAVKVGLAGICGCGTERDKYLEVI